MNNVDVLANRLIARIEQKGAVAESSLSGMGLVTDEDLAGLGFSLKKSFKKVVGGAKHAVKVQTGLVKKTARIGRLAVTHPRQAIKETVKLEESVVRNTVKTGRDVAPYAAVAAAIYFGGPAALQYLQATGASGMVSGATTMLKTAGVVQSLQAIRESNPQAADEMQQLPPEQLMDSPLVADAAGVLTEQAVTAETGYAMESPEAKQLTGELAKEGTAKAAAAAKAPKSDAGKLLAWGVPLAVLAKIALV